MVHYLPEGTGPATGTTLDTLLYLIAAREGIDLIKEIQIKGGFCNHLFGKHLIATFRIWIPV